MIILPCTLPLVFIIIPLNMGKGGKKEEGEPLIYKDKEYRFCCATCRWAFEQNPEQFIES